MNGMNGVYTELLLELVDLGEIDPETALRACLKHMSDRDVQDMIWIHDLVPAEYLPDQSHQC
jgi:hypothetical protein